MKHTLEVDSILLEFGNKRVLQNVFIQSETGKITGLLGRNGSGKTCLMNIIFGELQTYNKSIRLNGKVINNNCRNPEDFRYLPQYEFIPKGLTIRRIFKDYDLSFSRFINEFPDFEKYYNMTWRKLSGGEQRIIEIYAILASKTKFCMLDEPFSQVMPIHVETLKRIILQEKKNKGIILTDHLYKHVNQISDNLYVIFNGKTYLIKDIGDLSTLGYIR